MNLAIWAVNYNWRTAKRSGIERKIATILPSLTRGNQSHKSSPPLRGRVRERGKIGLKGQSASSNTNYYMTVRVGEV
jgi:hypothetical protein